MPLSSKAMSFKDQSGGAVANNGSFRVYYSLGAAGAVPFVWETKPGTPKSTVVPAARAAGYDKTPMTTMISPPPSYQSRARKGCATTTRRAAGTSSSYWPSRWLPGWMARWLGVRSRLWPSSMADGDRWLAPVDSGEDEDVHGRRPRRRAVLMCF